MRALNDELRKDFNQGHAVMTMGITALGAEAVARIVKTMEVYDDFCHENDPYEEHDLALEAEATRSFYDPALTVHSPDPSPLVTKRVITIMLAGKSPPKTFESPITRSDPFAIRHRIPGSERRGMRAWVQSPRLLNRWHRC
jgi:hypothetical protein